MKSDTKRAKDIENPEDLLQEPIEALESKSTLLLASNKKQTPGPKVKVLEQGEPVEMNHDIHVKEELTSKKKI